MENNSAEETYRPCWLDNGLEMRHQVFGNEAPAHGVLTLSTLQIALNQAFENVFLHLCPG